MDNNQTIFLSHSRADKNRVTGLGLLLESLSHKVFLDHKTILPGRRWEASLQSGLDESDVLIVYWTRHAAKSDWVRNEIEYFSTHYPSRSIVPIIGDETPLSQLLHAFQASNLFPFINELLELKKTLTDQKAKPSQIEEALLKRLREAGIELGKNDRKKLLKLFMPAGYLGVAAMPLAYLSQLINSAIEVTSQVTVNQALALGGAALTGAAVCNIVNGTIDSARVEPQSQVVVKTISGTLPDDPAPEANTVGETGCDGCPDIDISSFEQNLGEITSNTFSDVVSNVTGDGEFYLVTPEGRSILGEIPTDISTGLYSVEIPLFCGDQFLKRIWTNASGKYILVTKLTTTNCDIPDIRSVLTWDAQGSDWELHLIKENGRINDNETDCTWTSCINSSPDWGMVGDASDNPKKDVDNTGSFGPENIFLSSPENGTYTIAVEHWGRGSADSDGQVVLFVKDTAQLFKISNLAPGHVWIVATIKWPEGIITEINTDHDCNSNWSSGCQDAIP
jgi:hypothetical protein